MTDEMAEKGVESCASLSGDSVTPIYLSEGERLAAGLNHRERQVLAGLRDGATDHEIAQRIGISDKTVNFYVRTLATKLDSKNRTHTVVKALKLGLIALD